MTPRARYPLPPQIRDTLCDRGLWEAYQARPPYQRNDYIGWITRAKREETRQRRLDQMIEELAAGDRYMKMPHRAAGRGGV